MPVSCVDLSKIKRRFHLPFPLESVGIIENHPYMSVVVKGKLELCVRLSSDAEQSREWFDDTCYTVRYPNVALKVPNVTHSFIVDHPRDAFYFKFEPAQADAMKCAGFFEPPYCWEFRMTPQISRMLREMRDLMVRSAEPGIADRMDLLAMCLFEELLLMRDSVPGEKEYMNARIHRIASCFQLNFCREIDLDEIAGRYGFSRRNFYRCWKRCFPVSPAAYLLELKLGEAARLLKETAIPVYRITAELKFRNSAYFCLLFRKKYGMTPLQYRKKETPEKGSEK